MKYIFYFIAEIFFMILCYLTNPIAVLFADKNGELHGIWKYWQTWDSTLDNQHYVEKYAFSFLRYDYSSYAVQDTIVLNEYNREKYVSKQIADLPLLDKLKRYGCRVCWIYRNCGYGFAFYTFGTWVDQTKLKYLYQTKTDDGKAQFYICYEAGKSLWNTPWTLYSNMPINKYIEWCVYCGWKIAKTPPYPSIKQRAMIANRITIHGRD